MAKADDTTTRLTTAPSRAGPATGTTNCSNGAAP